MYSLDDQIIQKFRHVETVVSQRKIKSSLKAYM